MYNSGLSDYNILHILNSPPQVSLMSIVFDDMVF
jgi:hypothetical protein